MAYNLGSSQNNYSSKASNTLKEDHHGSNNRVKNPTEAIGIFEYNPINTDHSLKSNHPTSIATREPIPKYVKLENLKSKDT